VRLSALGRSDLLPTIFASHYSFLDDRREIQHQHGKFCSRTVCPHFPRFVWGPITQGAQTQAGQSRRLAIDSGAITAEARTGSGKPEANKASHSCQAIGGAEDAGLTACRARVKGTISQLEKRVEMLTHELHMTRLENASLRQENQLNPPGTIPTVAPLQPIPEPEFFPEGASAIMKAVRQKSRMLEYVEMSPQFSDSMVIAGQISTGNRDSTRRETEAFSIN
jgi:hypothetical protein